MARNRKVGKTMDDILRREIIRCVCTLKVARDIALTSQSQDLLADDGLLPSLKLMFKKQNPKRHRKTSFQNGN